MKEMIQKVREDHKGFTLAELLIVVAIIAVLVAIAIPVFTSQLDKAKHETAVANVRSTYAECVADYLTDSNSTTTSATFSSTVKTKCGTNALDGVTKVEVKGDTIVVTGPGTLETTINCDNSIWK